MSRTTVCMFVLLLVSAVGPHDASGLSEGTHQIVNEQAVRQSSLGDRISRLGLRDGIDEIVNGQPVTEWFRLGGFQEDRPYCRSTRHFHDPLKPWPEAGLTTDLLVIRVCGRSPFASSLVWSQTVNQDPEGQVNGNWSWHDARIHFFAALTEPKPKRRDEAWADTFRALGHVMHLVVDASVPEHVRNESHLTESMWRFIGLRGHGNYEHWVSDQHKRIVDVPEFTAKYLRRPISFDSSLLKRPTEDAGAAIPIANLIDAGVYDGTATGLIAAKTNSVGIAEFANANFFSEDTWDGTAYAFPNPRTLVPTKYPIVDGSRARSYYMKADGDGVAVNPVLAECAIAQSAFDSGVPSERTVKCTDTLVWQRVAEAMLPRAAGYAQGILDYFFRGKMELRVASAQLDPSGLRFALRVANRTEDEAMSGTLSVHYDTDEGERVLLSSWPVALEANAEVELPPLPPPMTGKPPVRRNRYLFVFSGRLGREPRAVIGQWADASAWYLREVTFSSVCDRLPSNQMACERQDQGRGRALVPDADGLIHGGELSASWMSSATIGGPLHSGDGSFLYLNHTQDDFSRAYLYRDGGGGRVRITGNLAATPWGVCSVTWGIPMGPVESLLDTSFFGNPPLFARESGGTAAYIPGTFTATVPPQAESLLIRVISTSSWPPFTGAGTFTGSARCDITSIQIAEAE